MLDIEIPLKQDRGPVYRFFEMLPGLSSLLIFLTPIGLSLVNPVLAAYYLIVYILIWVFKTLAMSRRVIQGYGNLKQAGQLDWVQMADELNNPKETLAKNPKAINRMHKFHLKNLANCVSRPIDIDRSEIIHAVMIATWNEPPEIIEPTIDSVVACAGVNNKNTIFFLAYEDRAGEVKKKQSIDAVKKYKKYFRYAEAVKHTLSGDELPGKGANASYCGPKIAQWAKKNGIDSSRVLVTVLDSDNRPDKNYFSSLSYTYMIAPDRKHKSYQPVALYINNIWDVPTIMRLSAVANTYFHTANSMRPHALRNFSAHAQSLDALIDTNYWSVRTIVEDGHQFWRTYFRYDGCHEVLPLYTPIYQDAVYVGTYWKSLVAQFKQIRRWTYGASDVAYVASKALKGKKRLPRWDVLFKFGRLLEAHVGWATSTPLFLLSGWIPLFVASNSRESIVAQQLPIIIGRINTFAMLLLLITVYISFATLPPKPKEYSILRYGHFIWQWALLPVAGIVFNSFAAISSQTRLIFGRYHESFDLTEKAVKKN